MGKKQVYIYLGNLGRKLELLYMKNPEEEF